MTEIGKLVSAKACALGDGPGKNCEAGVQISGAVEKSPWQHSCVSKDEIAIDAESNTQEKPAGRRMPGLI